MLGCISSLVRYFSLSVLTLWKNSEWGSDVYEHLNVNVSTEAHNFHFQLWGSGDPFLLTFVTLINLDQTAFIQIHCLRKCLHQTSLLPAGLFGFGECTSEIWIESASYSPLLLSGPPAWRILCDICFRQPSQELEGSSPGVSYSSNIHDGDVVSIAWMLWKHRSANEMQWML